MLRHILLIQFTNTTREEDILDIFNVFHSVQKKIPGIKAITCGLNNSPEGLNKNFTHCITMDFIDNAARDVYLPHPDHEELKQQFVPMIKDIVVFDYSL
ncbi:Dabb family protein [Marinomonas sp. 2405UD68-3]|uniref:Dabb family protein n=1 Tax=Marinomonas sp. 2405UD68-3 TaxID=3391835 RepID=UPI0039C99928